MERLGEHRPGRSLYARGVRRSKRSAGPFRSLTRTAPHPKTGKRRNLGTFKTRKAAEKHERAVQYFKRH